MNNICIGNLVGVPASGKSTFCRRFCEYLKERRGPFNAIHIEFDDFVRAPSGDLQSYFESKTFKRDRFRLRWLIREFVNEIKTKGSIQDTLLLARTNYPGCRINFTQHSDIREYFLLIDDNMYYKSMRKEIRSLARETEIGYFVLFFQTDLESAVHRNNFREKCSQLDEEIIRNMFTKFENPEESQEFSIVGINIGENPLPDFEDIVAKVQISLRNPLRPITEQSTVRNVVEQSILHQIDLMLRKEISLKMKGCNAGDGKKDIAKVLCQKRQQILVELKTRVMELPNDLHDLKMFI